MFFVYKQIFDMGCAAYYDNEYNKYNIIEAISLEEAISGIKNTMREFEIFEVNSNSVYKT